MVGTFYRSSSPGGTPLVEVGTVVKEGESICIIEAMKVTKANLERLVAAMEKAEAQRLDIFQKAAELATELEKVKNEELSSVS